MRARVYHTGQWALIWPQASSAGPHRDAALSSSARTMGGSPSSTSSAFLTSGRAPSISTLARLAEHTQGVCVYTIFQCSITAYVLDVVTPFVYQTLSDVIISDETRHRFAES